VGSIYVRVLDIDRENADVVIGDHVGAPSTVAWRIYTSEV
jgi:hypothetical protein